jgi:hypothetical protein
LKLLHALLSLLGAVAQLFAARRLLKAGAAEQREADMKEVEDRVEKADHAVRVADPDRTERLRRRFDRSSGGQ